MTPKGAWPRSRVLLLKQWDRYPRSTERISCSFTIELRNDQQRKLHPASNLLPHYPAKFECSTVMGRLVNVHISVQNNVFIMCILSTHESCEFCMSPFNGCTNDLLLNAV